VVEEGSDLVDDGQLLVLVQVADLKVELAGDLALDEVAHRVVDVLLAQRQKQLCHM